jgi:hypothetical protein
MIRRMGIPPRSTLQLVVHGLGLTLSAAGMTVALDGEGLPSWLRGALFVGGALPVLGLAVWKLIPRRRAYAFTDAGRGLVRHGKTVIAFPLAPAPRVRYDANREAGDLDFGTLEVEVLEGRGAGGREVWPVSLHDVPYPHAALEVLSELASGAG